MSSLDNTCIVQAALQNRFISSAQVVQLNEELVKSPAASATALMLARGFITKEQWQQLDAMTSNVDPSVGMTSGGETLPNDTDVSAAPGDLTGTGDFSTVDFQSPTEATGRVEDSASRTDIVGSTRKMPAVSQNAKKRASQWTALQSAPDKRYEWQEEFARGGLGAVWLVHDSNLERQVAVKELLPNGLRSKSAVERFLTEAQVTGQLEHPGIVPVYDAGTKANGCPFYSMKLLDGSPFSDVIAEFHERTAAGPVREVEFRRLLSIFVGVCHAIEYAHQRRVLHRDLKPQNVVVGNFGEAIVVDWGLAKVLNDEGTTDEPEECSESAIVSPEDAATTLLTGVVRRSVPDKAGQTLAGTVMGTPAYMPPEQARGELTELDHRADIFSLGAILFQLLTGRPPLKGNNLDELLCAAREGRHPDPRSIKQDISLALNAVCQKAMSAAPADRYQSARELSEEIDRWLAFEPVLAWPEPWTVRAQRWIRKHKSLVGSVAGALVTITAVSVVAAILIDNSRRAERDSKIREQVAKQEATESLRAAQESVDEWLIDVSYSMQWFPELDQTRQQLLESAAEHYRDFADRNAQDLPLQIEVAKSSIRLGDVRRLLSEWTDSETAFRTAVEELERLADEHPGDTTVQLHLANAHAGLAMLSGQTGDSSSALTSYREASAIFERLTAYSTDPLIHDGFGRCQNSQALLLQDLGNTEAARKLLHGAIEHFAKAVALDDRLRFSRRKLSAQLDLGHLLNESGEGTLASETFRLAIAGYDELLTQHADEPELLHGMAAARLSLANSLRHRGDKSVIEAYESAIATFTEIVERQPRAMHFRENLAIAQLDFAQFQHAVALTHEARETATQSLENQLAVVDYAPDVAAYHATESTIRHTLGEILSDLAEDEFAMTAFDGAIKKFQELSDLFPEVTDYRTRFAESLTARGQLLTKLDRLDEARQLLDRAIGQFGKLLDDDPKNVSARFGRASALTAHARLELASRSADAAKAGFQLAIKEFELLPTEPEYQFAFGWLLANCELPELRDAAKAQTIAGALTGQMPSNARYWNLSAMASCRTGDFQRCVETVEAGQKLQLADDGIGWLILAISQAQVGELSAAETSYNKALTARGHCRPGNIQSQRLSVEAAGLLHLP
jgi:eukaryotic-like serine/threonine-protein kinase